MKTLLYIPLLLVGMLLATTLSAQEDKCPLRPFEFDPNIVQRDVPNPELDTTDIPLGKGTGKFRKIYWVHGMKGNSGSWSSAVEYTQKKWAAYAVTRSLDYKDAQYSLSGAAAHLNSQGYFPEYFAEDTLQAQEMQQDFIVAHSMGGLVSRYLDKHYNDNPLLAKPFGGLITFGTPHAGAELARWHVQDTAAVGYFVRQSCRDLLEGPSKELVITKKLFRALEAITFKDNVQEIMLDFACDKVAGIGLKVVSDQFAVPAEKDMVPNSDALQKIANVPYKGEPLHTMAFYGEELDEEKDGFGSGDLAIRFLFSATKDVNGYPLMGADAMDDEALAEATEMLSFYQEKRDYWIMKTKQIAVKHNWLGYNIGFWPLYAKKIKDLIEAYGTARAYERGVTWFSLLNERWKFMIGASQYLPGPTNCYCRCLNEEIDLSANSYDFYVEYPVPCDQPMACNAYAGQHPLGCSFSEEYDLIISETVSDGLVTRESAMAMPNVKSIPLSMYRSGHFQMRNDSNLENELFQIFGGGYDNYFKLGQ